MELQHRKRLNREIFEILRQALGISLTDPRMSLFLLGALLRQNKAARRRELWERRGVHVPPFLIASITRRCNLSCVGCYARVQNRPHQGEMSMGRFNELMDEAQELGFSFALLAGGEPLTRPDILDVTASHRQIIFPFFTNGTLLCEQAAKKLKRQKNVIPVLSLEGLESHTDARRGPGVYRDLLRAMSLLKRKRIFFGVSLTVDRRNLPLLTGEPFVRRFAEQGCRLFFYVEYIPVQEGTEGLVISRSQREELELNLRRLRRRFRRLFISFPGDEKNYGGCLAAGRGFVHIGPDGGLEPCPFAPYSDTNLREISLKHGLESVFLNEIRQSEEHLQESEGGCALWNKREWVRSLLVKGGAGVA